MLQVIESRSFPREFRLERAPQRKAARTFRHWAPPFIWSPWYRIATLSRPAVVSIETRSLSQAKFLYKAEVAFFDRRGQRQIFEFGVFRSIRIEAGRLNEADFQEIKVRFKSSFTGQTILTIVRY